MHDLPAPLRMEIAHAVVGAAFGRIPVLADAPGLTRKRLADAMRKQIAAADTTVFEVHPPLRSCPHSSGSPSDPVQPRALH